MQVGVGGTLAVVLIREVFNFVKPLFPKQKAAEPLAGAGQPEKTGAVPPSHLKMLEDLHSWHNMRDADGVPVWYIKQDLRTAAQQNLVILHKLEELADVLLQVQKSQAATTHSMVAIADLESRISELQERRVTEAGSSVRTSMSHVAETTRAVTEMVELLRELKSLVT